MDKSLLGRPQCQEEITKRKGEPVCRITFASRLGDVVLSLTPLCKSLFSRQAGVYRKDVRTVASSSFFSQHAPSLGGCLDYSTSPPAPSFLPGFCMNIRLTLLAVVGHCDALRNWPLMRWLTHWTKLEPWYVPGVPASSLKWLCWICTAIVCSMRYRLHFTRGKPRLSEVRQLSLR